MITVGPDPYFYQQKAQQFGQTIGALMGALADRRQRREEREARQLDFSLRLMEQYPEVAGSIGPSLRARHPDRPDVAALLDVFENRNRLRTEAEGAYTDYMRSVDEEDRRLEGLGQLAAGPTLIPGPLPIPNIPAIRAGVELMTTTPDSAYMNAASRLSPSRLEQAHIGAKILGMTPPPAIMTDPTKLPDSVYAGYVYDRLPPAAREIVDTKLRERTSQEDLAERAHAVDLSERTTARQRESQKSITERQEKARASASAFQDRQQQNAVSLERLKHQLRRETAAITKASGSTPEDRARAREYARYVEQLTKMVVGSGKTKAERDADASRTLRAAQEELRRAFEGGAMLPDVWGAMSAELRANGRWKG